MVHRLELQVRHRSGRVLREGLVDPAGDLLSRLLVSRHVKKWTTIRGPRGESNTGGILPRRGEDKSLAIENAHGLQFPLLRERAQYATGIDP